MTIGSTGSSEVSLARALTRAALAVDPGRFDAEVIAKAKICLLDFLSCAFEARNHPWSRQAIGIAREVRDGATVIGTRTLASPGDAAFANAIMGHGLVREDMHAASICHHGVVIWPALLALSERTTYPARNSCRRDHRLRGRRQIGRALFTAELARLFRPTGLVAPIGAALAGSYAARPVGRRRNQRDCLPPTHRRPQPMAAFRRLRNVFPSRFCGAKCD